MSRSKRVRRQNKRVSIEQLERRELLAADLGFAQQNQIDPMDVNDDTFVTAADALEVINRLNRGRDQQAGDGRGRFLDVNGDQAVSAVDALMVMNDLNRRARGERRERGPAPTEPTDPSEGSPEFSPIDGVGNNVDNPQLGSANVAFEREFGVDYADGLGTPVDDLPSARSISNIVNATPGDIENAAGLSDLTWLFGQFIDHDITLTGEGAGEHFNVEVPTGDPFFDPLGTGEATISLERSGYEEDASSVRQQINEITAFIDGSVVYGSDAERAAALRSFEGGKLLTSEGELLPFNTAGLGNAGGTSESLFLAGDVRANENAALAAMHTVWVREHNRITDEIASDNPNLNDEELYQLARQRVTAQLQAITYNEFLPALLGENALSDYTGYDSSVNPNLSNVFSTAAYRFGHTMLSPELLRLNADGSVADEGNLSLQDAFFNVDALTENGIDSILLGASVQAAQEVDPFLVDDVRNFLFGPPGSGGFDLASLNIQRGRDHGLPSYNEIREKLGQPAATSFADISSNAEIQARLEEAYAGDINAVDAWVGMLAEDHATGSTLGATAGTVIAQQFEALRDGDRFYYENLFSGRELQAIDNTTLADVIERNTSIDFARNQNVFVAQAVGDEDTGGRNDRDTGRDRQRNRSSQFPVEERARANDQAIEELTRDLRRLG